MTLPTLLPVRRVDRSVLAPLKTCQRGIFQLSLPARNESCGLLEENNPAPRGMPLRSFLLLTILCVRLASSKVRGNGSFECLIRDHKYVCFVCNKSVPYVRYVYENKSSSCASGDILEEVDQIAGKRKRSLFIAQATREKLQRGRFLRTLEETQGAWNDKNHPELKTARDMEQFISDKRQPYRFHHLPPIES